MGLWGSLAAPGTGLLSLALGNWWPEFPSGIWDGERRRSPALPIPAGEWGQVCVGLHVNAPAQMLTPSPMSTCS